VDGVWLQAVLTRLAPFPWDARRSLHHGNAVEEPAAAVRAGAAAWGERLSLPERAARLPGDFLRHEAEPKGVQEGEFAALCTSAPEVRDYLAAAVESICRAVPGLGGFFTITGSENLTNCWSHGGGGACPRCGKRAPAESIRTQRELLRRHPAGGNGQTLIVWDWGWHDDWVESIIARFHGRRGS